MRWFTNRSIRAKLTAAFLAVLTLTALLGGLAVVQLARVSEAAREIETNWLPSAHWLGVMNTHGAEVPRRRTATPRRQGPADKERWEREIDRQLSEFRRVESDYVRTINTDREQHLYDLTRPPGNQFFTASARFRDLSRQGKEEEARVLLGSGVAAAVRAGQGPPGGPAGIQRPVRSGRQPARPGPYVSARWWIGGGVAGGPVPGAGVAVGIAAGRRRCGF